MRGIRFLKAWLQVSSALLVLAAIKAFVDLELLYKKDTVLVNLKHETSQNLTQNDSFADSDSESYEDVKLRRKEFRTMDLLTPPPSESGTCKVKFEKIQDKTVVLGIGSGRCGTRAFSKFINQNIGTYVTHEFNHCEDLSWDDSISVNSPSLVGKRYKYFIDRKASIVGDVALWYLPYIEQFLEYSNVKVIVLKRNREDTVKSFVKWFGGRKHFPWAIDDDRRDSGGRYINHPMFDSCYPSFEWKNLSKVEVRHGAERYYDFYYKVVDRLVRACNDRIFVVDSYEALNNKTVKYAILKWLGAKKPYVLITGFKNIVILLFKTITNTQMK